MPKSDADHPTVGPQKEIEQEAIDLFNFKFKKSYFRREQKPDYFIDYVIEVSKEGELTGLHFGAQVKGSKNQKNGLRKNLETKCLNYYLKSCRYPIFIFLVQLKEQTVHWLFAQQYLLEQVPPIRLQNQKTLTLKFNKKNELSDFKRFEEQLDLAFPYVNNLFPGSPVAAIQSKKRFLESKDPRIDVRLSVTDNGEVLNLTAKSPIKLHGNFQVSASEFKEAFHQVINLGRPSKLTIQNLTITGSPLLEELVGKQNKGILHLPPFTRPGYARLTYHSRKLSEPATVQIDGNWNIGQKITSFAGLILGSPISLSTTLEIGPENLIINPSIQINVNWRLWFGLSVLALPQYFESRSLLMAAQEGTISKWTWHLDESELLSFRQESPMIMEGVESILKLIEGLRLISYKCGVDLVVPEIDKITAKQEEDFEILATLVRGEIYSEIIPTGSSISFSAEPSQALSMATAIGKPPSDFSIIQQKMEFSIFGKVVVLPLVEQIYSDVVFAEAIKEENQYRLVYKTTKSTRLSIQWKPDFCPPDPPDWWK